jgi:A/G-specific adenine glycosylase
MKRDVAQRRLATIRRRLLAWWDQARRDLPWRFPPGHVDPYRVWISEVMLQQTQVATVIPYYARFLARFPTLEALAQASEEQVLARWSGLGYYARARRLLEAARAAMELHGGLPRTVEELRKLPGFGPYTAGAVASIAYGVATPAVDGNVARVLSRLFLVSGRTGEPRFTKRVWERADELVAGKGGPNRWSGDLNQALIELGALVCRPRPRCADCPLSGHCLAHAAGRERSTPGVRRRGAAPQVTLAVGLCRSRESVLLVRRPAQGLFAGMWAPPSVTLGAHADGASEISAAIRRELSVETGEFTYSGTVERRLTHRRLRLQVYSATLREVPPTGEGWLLAAPGRLAGLPIPEAMRRALALAG